MGWFRFVFSESEDNGARNAVERAFVEVVDVDEARLRNGGVGLFGFSFLRRDELVGVGIDKDEVGVRVDEDEEGADPREVE